MINLDNNRIDYYFSYWIFAWFILYYYKIVSYSPLFAVIIAIINNIFMFCYLLYNYLFINNSYYYFFGLIAFIIINFIIKILPLYYMIKIENNVKTNEDLNKLIKKDDIIVTLYLFIIYAIWLFINKKIYFKNYFIHTNISTVTPLYNIIYNFFEKRFV